MTKYGIEGRIQLYAYKCPIGTDFNDATGLCEKGQPDPCEATENPVHITTGNKTISETDFESAGNSLLRFQRNWNSQTGKWEFSFRQYLVERTNTQRHFIRVYRPSGWNVAFADKNGGWTPEARVTDRLTMDGEEWLYTMSSGDREWYDGSGRLVRVLQADGRGVTVGYPTETLIVVADDYGNQLKLNLDTSGRVVSMIDPDGAVYSYAYNNAGNLEYVIFPEEGSTPVYVRQYHYDDVNPNLVTKITDENGDVYKTIEYDTVGLAALSGLSDGTVGQSTFDNSLIYAATDPRVTVTNPLGKQAVYHLESHYGLVNVTQVDGIEQASTGCLADVHSKQYYRGTGWTRLKTDKAGNTTFYEYYNDVERRGLVKRRIEALFSTEQRIFEFEWDAASRRKKQETLVGVRKTDYTYHANGKRRTRTETDLTGRADVAARTWTYTYTYYDPGTDTEVATLTVDGPRTDVSDVTVTEYSVQGYLTQTTDALGHVTRYENHNGRGQPRSIVDANGIVTELTYTARGWLDTITQDVGGLNALTDLDYDHVGQLTAATLPDGVHVEFRYDAAHRLYETENALGETIRYELDAAGNRDGILLKDHLNNVVQTVDYDFDGLSRLWKEFGSYGQRTEYTRDEKDHLTTITATKATGNLVTMQDFDAQNRLQRVTDADNKNVFIDYDAEDRVEKVTDQRGLATDYVYDGFGNLQQLISPDTGTTGYDYDAAGNRLQQIDARGVVTNYTYDALNRLTTVKYPGEPAKNLAYTYDNYTNGLLSCSTCNGQMSAFSDSSGTTWYVYDVLGRMDKRINAVKVPGGGTIDLGTDFDFNDAGRLEQVQYPNGELVNYTFDAAGQVETVRYKARDPNDALKNIATNITHQPFGRLNAITYGNNLQLNRSYDLDGRLDTQSVSGVQSLDYNYDEVNNIDGIDDLIDDSRDEAFSYDKLNRLESASGKYGDIDYEYDAAGNRESRSVARDGITVVEDHQVDTQSNRLDQIEIHDGSTSTTRKFKYDKAGNLIEEKRADGTYMRPVYDATNRMERVSQ